MFFFCSPEEKKKAFEVIAMEPVTNANVELLMRSFVQLKFQVEEKYYHYIIDNILSHFHSNFEVDVLCTIDGWFLMLLLRNIYSCVCTSNGAMSYLLQHVQRMRLKLSTLFNNILVSYDHVNVQSEVVYLAALIYSRREETNNDYRVYDDLSINVQTINENIKKLIKEQFCPQV